jgi:hypothetical protein
MAQLCDLRFRGFIPSFAMHCRRDVRLAPVSRLKSSQCIVGEFGNLIDL